MRWVHNPVRFLYLFVNLPKLPIEIALANPADAHHLAVE
jgi:hypothetical protein